MGVLAMVQPEAKETVYKRYKRHKLALYSSPKIFIHSFMFNGGCRAYPGKTERDGWKASPSLHTHIYSHEFIHHAP